MQTVRPADRLHERFLTEDCYMVFSTPVFLFAFLPAVLLLFYLVPRRLKTLILLLSSLFFYFWGERAYTALMVFSIVVNYGSGLVIAALKSRGKAGGAKAMLIVSVVINLGMLIFFKYWDFLAESLQGLGLGFLPVLGIHLPIGISFYTFQTMSYTIDVYRADVPAQKNPVAFGAYVTMFPQLIAGPIVRYKDIAGQLDCRGVGWERFASGVFRFTVGLAKKLLLANALGQIWSGFRDVPTAQLTVAGAWLGVLAFSLQIYFDFSGYSDMAIGLGRMLGFHFLENFNFPYISNNLTEFWRRWHISLTTWFRDYVYFPLGGNRRGPVRKQINKMIVFLLSGLWHGASFSFVVWGGLNALYVILGDMLKPVRDKLVRRLGLHRESFGHRLVCCFWTFVLYDFGLIFFRSRSLHNSVRIARSVLTTANPWVLIDGSLLSRGLDAKDWTVLLIALLILFVADWQKHRGIRVREFITRQDAWFQIVVIVFSVCAILVFGIWGPEYSEANFVYFQF